MINSYTQKLEQIIVEMNAAVSNGSVDIATHEYQRWLDFLKHIHPESDVLKQKSAVIIDENFNKKVRILSNMQEIMRLAEKQRYPTWFIHPSCGESLVLEYEHGVLKNDTEKDRSIPKTLKGFTGKIHGVSSANSQFIAHDINTVMPFLKKMEILKNYGFTTTEFVLFPTDKIPTISSSKLIASFQNYISKARSDGLSVDGVIVVSDVPLFPVDNELSSRKMLFQII